MKEHRAPFPPVTRSKAGTGKHFTCPLGFITTDGTGASLTLCTAGGRVRHASAGEPRAVTSHHTLWGNSVGIDPAAEVWKTVCQQHPPWQTDAFPERVIVVGDFSQPSGP